MQQNWFCSTVFRFIQTFFRMYTTPTTHRFISWNILSLYCDLHVRRRLARSKRWCKSASASSRQNLTPTPRTIPPTTRTEGEVFAFLPAFLFFRISYWNIRKKGSFATTVLRQSGNILGGPRYWNHVSEVLLWFPKTPSNIFANLDTFKSFNTSTSLWLDIAPCAANSARDSLPMQISSSCENNSRN